MYLLGYDIGSSSVKAALVAAADGRVLATVHAPDSEMPISSPNPDWAEQDPEMWWQQLVIATKKLTRLFPKEMSLVEGIGISYQMHGLVLIDDKLRPLRPAIIWCDSRAVEIGERAFREIGEERCLQQLLNSPGNFTAAKLAWVKENEPEVYRRAYKMMLPGDYIAMRMTGRVATTPGGLSEAIFWDYRKNGVSTLLLDYFGISPDLIPDLLPNISNQGMLTSRAAEELGLQPGIKIGYRAGDQPNNAMSLNVTNPGEAAATGGTSGVVYGITDQAVFDPHSRVNSFLHVNHTQEAPRIGVLLCINGAGIQYSWIRQFMALNQLDYEAMDRLAAQVPVGADKLVVLPFGNGAERMLGNKNPGAHIANLHFNRHTNAHIYRAALEGVAFSFVHGMHILQGIGLNTSVIRVGNDNLFQSAIFAQTIANLMDCTIEVVNTTGAVGAARAAGISSGHYPDLQTAMQNIEIIQTIRPVPANGAYSSAYQAWEEELSKILTN
ncbi:MAG: carbohydrate kinase [Saprospirales bacterium]|nr:carbohydrate kinase [Saprospirales bacterium]